MTEDEIYRASTQYRLWSFTPEMLHSMRSTTNALAADGVRRAIHSLDMRKDSVGVEDPSREVDCLTVEEEQKLVWYYCTKTVDFADFCNLPTHVKVQIPLVLGTDTWMASNLGVPRPPRFNT